MGFWILQNIRVNMTNFHRLTLGSTSVIPLSVLPKLVLIFGLWSLLTLQLLSRRFFFFVASLEMCAHMLNLTWKHLSAWFLAGKDTLQATGIKAKLLRLNVIYCKATRTRGGGDLSKLNTEAFSSSVGERLWVLSVLRCECGWWMYRVDKYSSLYQLIGLQSGRLLWEFIHCRRAGEHEAPETLQLNDYNISNTDNWWSKSLNGVM